MAFPDGWGYRWPIAIHADSVITSPVSAWPCLITDVHFPAGAWAHMNADASDLRFSSDGGALPDRDHGPAAGAGRPGPAALGDARRRAGRRHGARQRGADPGRGGVNGMPGAGNREPATGNGNSGQEE